MLSTALVMFVVIVAIAGDRQLRNASDDALTRADAVVVLGGEHDGRERYGFELAKRIGATTVLLSDPYRRSDPIMRFWCLRRSATVTVLCDRPQPPTTRGEAEMARRYGRQFGWQRIVVVTWRYHLPRARFIFSQCYSPDPGRLVMRAVPASYARLSVGTWEGLYLYQYAGFAKAALEGTCPP